MKLNAWKIGTEKHIPALEVFLKTVLLRKCKVQLENTDTGSNKDAINALKQSGIIVRAVEENFETEIVFGFSESWIPLLAKAILDVDEAQKNEYINDLFEEFTRHLLDVIQDSFEEVGIELKIIEINSIKSGQLERLLNLQKYLMATYSVEHKFDIEADDDSDFNIVVAVAPPNKDKMEMLEVGFKDDNPFQNGDYVDASTSNAGSVDLQRVEEEPQDSQQSEQAQSNINIKGKDVEFENFDKSSAANNDREVRNINMLKNVEMNLSVELGRREMPLGKILKLVKGSVIELEKLAGEPVEILVNGHAIAQGDVVVIDEHFGVRISNLLATQEHLKELG